MGHEEVSSVDGAFDKLSPRLQHDATRAFESRLSPRLQNDAEHLPEGAWVEGERALRGFSELSPLGKARVINRIEHPYTPIHGEVRDLHGFLNPHDGVAISFWIISIAMVASTVFFLWESLNIRTNWKTSMNVGALVTLIAAGKFCLELAYFTYCVPS